MNTLLKLPLYAKASLSLIGLYVFVSMLSIAQDIILPLLFAIILAILISPVIDFLVKKKISRAVAITGVLTIVFLIIMVLVASLSSQTSRLIDAWPQLAHRFRDLLIQTVNWASGYFNISAYKINHWINNTKIEILSNSNAAIGITLTTMSGILAIALLTPVYIFMLLLYQPHLVEFLHRLFGARNNINVNEVLAETKTIVRSYLVGLFIEFIIVSVLNSVGLLILRIDYAILLGILGAFLNVIPYIGGIIAVALFIIIALVTKSPIYVIYVSGLYTIIQLIDNNYIVPKIIGSKVKLNALVSIIAVIAGAALWGIPGMFLSIPVTAIIKLVLDRMESLKPWGFLLGDTMPP